MSRTLIAGLIFALLVAAALRFPQLGARPMHNDEGVNAIKLRTLWEHGSYQYDPQEYHGPTLPYASWASMKLQGAKNYVDFTAGQLRVVTVVFGIGLILLLPLVRDGLGNRGVVCAAFLTAISPAMAFYSRYYIHEMLLVFFTFLALAAGWRYWRSGKLGWALLLGAAVGFMQSTKETFVLALGAMVVAFIANAWLNRAFYLRPRAVPARSGSEIGDDFKSVCDAEPAASRDGSRSGDCGRRCNLKHIIAAIAVWLVVVLVLFSSFFTNASGPLDAVRTYMPWLHRAAGASPHIHPWNFYFERLVWFHSKKGPIWSEGLILLLAVFGIIAAFQRKRLSEGCAGFVRFLTFYTVLLTIIYTVISYKTPWCLLNFWQGMILLAGVGVVALLESLGKSIWQIPVSLVLLAAAGQLAAQAWRADVPYAADSRNPYVYAQTSTDVTNLVSLVEALAKVSPQKHDLLIKVMAPENDYGPLPWYLRDFTRVGWWSELPQDPYAPVMIVSTKFDAKLDEKRTHLMVRLFELRPQTWFEVYVREDLWRAYVAAKPREE